MDEHGIEPELLSPVNDCPYTDVEDMEPSVQNGLHFLHLNIRSFHKNENNLKGLLDDLHFKYRDVDIIMLCETFFNDNNVSLCEIEGYHSKHLYRSNRTGGGVSIYVRDCIKFNKIVLSLMTDCTECLMIEVEINKKVHLIGSLYHIPNSNLQLFIDDLKMILKNTAAYKNAIIGADQNLDLLKINTHSGTERFLEIMMQSEFMASINKPTRVTHSSGTLIDNLHIKCSINANFESFVINDGMSDHYPCLLTLHGTKVCGDKIIETTKLDNAAILKINQELLFTNWEPMIAMGVNESYVFFRDKITDALNKYEPLKRRIINSKDVIRDPWMSVSLLKCNQKCRKLCKMATQSGLSMHMERYRKYRQALNRVKQYAKKSFYANVFEKIGKNSKMLWEVLNTIVKKSNNKVEITSVKSHGITVTDPRQVANTFNEHFLNVGKNTKNSIVKVNTDPLCYTKRVNQSLEIKLITESQLQKIVNNMDSKQSTGCNGISNFLLKKIISCIQTPFCQLINKSIFSGTFPDEMKIAKVIPLYKDGSVEEPNNFRPISLLPVLSKVLEKYIFWRTVEFFDRNDVIYKRQFGFCRHHSTIHAV